VNASAEENVEDTCISIEAVTQDLIKEWKSLKRILMQRFPVSKVISFSPVTYILCIETYYLLKRSFGVSLIHLV
jgi:hypothetical protein